MVNDKIYNEYLIIFPLCRCYLPGARSLIGSLKTLEISTNFHGRNFSTQKAL
jgi:hypothetical protein